MEVLLGSRKQEECDGEVMYRTYGHEKCVEYLNLKLEELACKM